MAESSKNSVAPRRLPSRLQNRAPASIQVNPASSFASGWKIAIPLLSPVEEPEDEIIGACGASKQESQQQERQSSSSSSSKPMSRSWQHPAAPFYNYGSTPAFVPQCT